MSEAKPEIRVGDLQDIVHRISLLVGDIENNERHLRQKDLSKHVLDQLNSEFEGIKSKLENNLDDLREKANEVIDRLLELTKTKGE